MRLLLDSHILIAVAQHKHRQLPPTMQNALADTATIAFASMASLWELEIKYRIGKLDVAVAPKFLPKFLDDAEISLLLIHPNHVFADIGPEPRTKDPFDRLLLGVCAAEGLKLVTLDRVLAEHPLSW